MPRDLQKVQKTVRKKRGTLTVHEKSRDAKLLRRAAAREDRLARVASTTMKARQGLLDRVAYFQECLTKATGPLTLSDETISKAIQQWIHRNDAELEELRAERRKGRPPSKREELIQERMQAEEREFRSGFYMPDVTDEDSRRQLQEWNGEWSSLSTIKFIRFAEGGRRQPSSFPPRGVS
ncbi:hypothetical protein VTN49DRAFT_5957 [Thermomyces lanuginosus]|uniref:uncharacterized protein n=1 Tax=Thermomyces lanuginosus TaxID=5541 RepID=UPI0037432862